MHAKTINCEDGACHICGAMINGYVARSRNHILVFNKDNLHLEYKNCKEGDKDV